MSYAIAVMIVIGGMLIASLAFLVCYIVAHGNARARGTEHDIVFELLMLLCSVGFLVFASELFPLMALEYVGFEGFLRTVLLSGFWVLTVFWVIGSLMFLYNHGFALVKKWWNGLKKLGRSVGRKIKDGAKAVVRGAVKGVKALGRGVVNGGKAIGGGLRKIGSWLGI